MAKIWEIHYTTFSGTFNNEPQDTVGSGHLTVVGSQPVAIEPLPSFNVRRGVQFPRDGINQGYDYNSVDEAKFQTGAYGLSGRRSFVMWMYKGGSGDTNGSLWGEGDTSFTRSGLKMQDAGLNLVINNNFIYDSSAGFGNSQWHCIVVTIDPFASPTSDRVKLFLNNVQVANTSALPTSAYGTPRIGDLSGSREANAIIGYTATYDHILNDAEIEQIYNSFLVDSNDPVNFPYAEVSGKVFDAGGSPLGSADVIAFDSATDQIVASDTTTTGGDYTLQFESAGVFKVTASKPGVLGGKIVETVVSGGTVSFVTS